jgi:putative transposase
MVTAGTHQKAQHFRGPDRLTFLQDQLLSLALQYGWQLQAWALFPNHYHFVTLSPEDPTSLPHMLRHLHSVTAREVNRLDGTAGRKVWFQFWDTHLTFERSYLARLHYAHENPVRHGVVRDATHYPWCSAGWFELLASPATVKMVRSFRVDRLIVADDYEVALGA